VSRLLLHERTLPGGALEKTWLEADGGALFLFVEGAPKTAVPLAVLDAVMRRYGKPLADDVAVDGPRLELEGRALALLRYRPRYDVIAKDYLVYAPTGEPPIAELATAVTAALMYLLRSVCGARPGTPLP
jgi:hypothetical protein